MPCTKQTTKQYLARPSPPRRSKDCKGERRRGNDGVMWVSTKDKTGVYRWLRVAASPSRKSRKSPSRKSPARKSRSCKSPSRKSPGKSRYPCGTRTRAPCRWTRAELERLAIAQGIPYDGRTMDHLCSVLALTDATPAAVIKQLGAAAAPEAWLSPYDRLAYNDTGKHAIAMAPTYNDVPTVPSYDIGAYPSASADYLKGGRWEGNTGISDPVYADGKIVDDGASWGGYFTNMFNPNRKGDVTDMA